MFHFMSPPQIATTISQSGNKVYLDSDSLMINTLGDNVSGEKTATSKKGWY